MASFKDVLFFERYRATELLADDSVFSSYLGIDTTSEARVILKILNPDRYTRYDVDKICFFNEVVEIKKLDHQHILHLLEAGVYGKTMCVVYEYTPGLTLEDYLRSHDTLSSESALKLVLQLGEALRYAHSLNILHRHITPDCIYISDTTKGPSLKLYGFGMSHIIDFMSVESAEINNLFGCMAPEATGLLDRKVDFRSDLYSVGIIMYLLLTGSMPFKSDTIDNIIYQHVAVSVKSPSELNPTLPEAVSRAVIKLLSKNPDLRFQSASELINEIRKILSGNSYSARLTDRDLLASMDLKSKTCSRKSEYARLLEAYKTTTANKGSLCIIHGGIGSGKSKLLDLLREPLEADEVPFFKGHFTLQDSMTPYHAFHEILDSYVDVFEKYDRKTQLTERSRLGRAINGMSTIVTSICSEMTHVLPAADLLPSLEEYKEQQRTISLLANLFISLYPSDKPFVIELDDIQYADPASLQLLYEIATGIDKSRLFLVCSCRFQGSDVPANPALTQFLDSLNKDCTYTDIPLLPYDEPRLVEYLVDMLGISSEECQNLAPYLMDKAGGNPYFTLNVLKAMLEDNMISIRNGILEQDWNRISKVNSSDVLADIINRRLLRLSEDAIRFFEIAAVFGTEFSLAILHSITGLSKEDTFAWIDKALSLQFVEYASTRDTLKFCHTDVHKAFIKRLTPEEIKSWHHKIALKLESLYPAHEVSLYNLMYHFTEAGDQDGIYRHIVETARLARSTNANAAALKYYETALELINAREGKSSPDWLPVRQAVIELSLTVGHFSSAISMAEDLLKDLTDPLQRAEILQYIGVGYFRQSKFSDCEAVLLQALTCLGEKIPHSKLGYTLNYTFFRFNRALNPSVIQDTGARERIDAPQRIHTIVHIYEVLCWVYIYTDIKRFEYVVLYLYAYIFQNMGTCPELANSASALSIYYLLVGNLRQSNLMQTFTDKLLDELPDRMNAAKALFFAGLHRQWTNEIEESLKYFDEACKTFREIGDHWEVNNTLNYKAVSLLYLGNYTECVAVCNEVIRQADKLEDRFSLCHAYSTLVTCYTEMGDFTKAITVTIAADPIVEELNLPYISALYKLSHGKLLMERERFSDADEMLGQVCTLIKNNQFLIHYLAAVFGQRQLARIHVLETGRNALSPNDAQSIEYSIRKEAYIASSYAVKIPGQGLPSCRASAYIASSCEMLKEADQYYQTAIKLSSEFNYRYENALLDYDYGLYLLKQHRRKEARFHIFEAYMEFSALSSTNYQKKCETLLIDKFHENVEGNNLLANASVRRNRMNADRKINTLLKLGELLTSTLELEDLQTQILREAVELVGAERGILFLYPESGDQKLYVASVYNLGKFDCNTYDWMLSRVEATRKPIIINDVQSDEYRKHYADLARYGIKSVMVMPMFVRGSLFGIIYLDSRLVRSVFSDDYLETMGFIANQAGAPILNARLYHRAITDALTGIYGRSHLDNMVVDKTAQDKIKLSAIMIDVDNFKRCNDTYGHSFGDKVLVQIAGIMKRVVADYGYPCRYGGEEFVILLDSNDAEFVKTIAEKIRQTVESTSVPYSDGQTIQPISVTISLGISIWDSSMERIDLIEHADKAMYYAKTHGKNQVCMWNDSLK